MDSMVTRPRPIHSALSLLLAVLWLFSLVIPRSAAATGERPAPAIAASEHPAIPFVARSRQFAAPKAAPGTGLEPRPIVAVPEPLLERPERAAPRRVSSPAPPSQRTRVCSARGPPA